MPYASTIYVLLKRGIVCPVSDVDSEEITTLTTYTGETYRDSVDSSWLGRSVEYDPNIQQVTFVGTDQTPVTITPQGSAVFSGLKIEGGGGSPVTTNINGILDSNITDLDGFAQQDDQYTHTAPRFLASKRDMILYRSADSTIVGRFWLDQVLGVSSSLPTYPI